jgi:hypothetical protein
MDRRYSLAGDGGSRPSVSPWLSMTVAPWTVVPRLLALLLVATLLPVAGAMSPRRAAELRQQTVDMFYHGFNNYMRVAFPEDEVCMGHVPSLRDRHPLAIPCHAMPSPCHAMPCYAMLCSAHQCLSAISSCAPSRARP